MPLKITKRFISFAILLTLLIQLPDASFAWGFFSHRIINKMAVFSLPPEMIGFYKTNIDYISEHAVDPDKRSHSTKGEACKHYIDIDHYDPDPFNHVPRRWKDAVEKLTEDTLKAYGILPWNIQWCMYSLTEAFKEMDVSGILYWSTNIGHYIGDSHVPLHTTKNYNGHLTDQRGIHGLWETRMPEFMSDEYNMVVGRAVYLDAPLNATWESIKSSFGATDSVLLFEKQLDASFNSDMKYGVIKRSGRNEKSYSDEYVIAYDKMLNGMVETRFRLSIRNVASFWYTAWVNGGQPDLESISSTKVVEVEEKENKKIPENVKPRTD